VTTHPNLPTTLSLLGDTSAAIASALAQRHVTGKRNDPSWNPLANYLRGALPASFVTVTRDRIETERCSRKSSCVGAAWSKSDFGGMSPPMHVVEWLTRWDEGLWPELER
jgi:hypothetical protein